MLELEERLNDSIKRQKAKKKKNGGQDKKLKNQIYSLDKQYKMMARDMYIAHIPVNFVIILLCVSTYGFLAAVYDSFPVAKLPFEPFVFMTRITHRGLPGKDYSECSFAFIVAICGLAIKPNIKKLLALAPAKSISNSTFLLGGMDAWDLEMDDGNDNDKDNHKRSK